MLDALIEYSGMITSVLLHSLWQVGLVWVIYRLTYRHGRKSIPGLYWPVFAIALFSLATLSLTGSTVTMDLGIGQITTARKMDWATLAVMVWLVGVAFQSIRLALDYFHISAWKQRGDLVTTGALFEEMGRLSSMIGLKRLPDLRIVTDLSIPMVVGFFRPVVLFPVSLMTQLSPEEIESILLHELSHIKRQDYLWNIVLSVFETLLFFNPFVHWLIKDIRAAREVSCDLQAAEITRQPRAMASALLTIEEMLANPKLAMSLNSQGHLSQRVHVLMDVKKKKRRLLSPAMTAWAILGLLPFFLAFHGTDNMSSMKARQYDVKLDSITVPGFHNAIHSLEFESVDGEIKDIRINDEPVKLTDPEQVYSLRDQMSESSTDNNRMEEYQNGLEEKYGSRKSLRQNHQELDGGNPSKKTQTLSKDKTLYDLSAIEGYQYGKSLDTTSNWQEWKWTEEDISMTGQEHTRSERSYFLKLQLDPEDRTVGDVIIKYDPAVSASDHWEVFSSEYVEEEIERLLLDRGLIRNARSYNLILTHDLLQVNGKELSDKMHRLFKARYMDMTRKDPSSKFNYQILKNQIR